MGYKKDYTNNEVHDMLQDLPSSYQQNNPPFRNPLKPHHSEILTRRSPQAGDPWEFPVVEVLGVLAVLFLVFLLYRWYMSRQVSPTQPSDPQPKFDTRITSVDNAVRPVAHIAIVQSKVEGMNRPIHGFGLA